VHEVAGATVNAPLGAARLDVQGSDESVTVELGTGMEVSVGSRRQPVPLRVPLTDPSLLIVPLVLTLAYYGRNDMVMAEHELEVRAFESDRLVHEIEALAARTQVSRDPRPLMSIARYFDPLTPWVPFIAGAEVLISGCGSGGELLAVLALGAKRVTGVEMAGAELDLAREISRHAAAAQVIPYADGLPGVPVCGIVMSRHVLEHVPIGQRRKCLVELLGRLKPGGHLLLEAPNQDCPIEPHTAVRFFHWLTDSQQERVVEYLLARSAAVTGDRAEADLLDRLRGHRNVRLDEVTSGIDGFGTVEQVSYSDSAFVQKESLLSMGDTLRVVIRRS